MGLTVLLSGGIIELQCSQSRTGHKQEGDILYILYVLLVDVLDKEPFLSVQKNRIAL